MTSNCSWRPPQSRVASRSEQCGWSFPNDMTLIRVVVEALGAQVDGRIT